MFIYVMNRLRLFSSEIIFTLRFKERFLSDLRFKTFVLSDAKRGLKNKSRERSERQLGVFYLNLQIKKIMMYLENRRFVFLNKWILDTTITCV